MKSIRPVIFIFVSLFALEVFALQSQSPQSAGRARDQQLPSVQDLLEPRSQKLNLSQTQRAKIKIILEDQIAQMRAIRSDGSLSPEDKMKRERFDLQV